MDALLMEKGQLGLNIVCEESSPLPKPKRKNKKFNKYEKRRAKARQAKGLVEKKEEVGGVVQKETQVRVDSTNDNGEDQEVKKGSVEQEEPVEESVEQVEEPAQQEQDVTVDTYTVLASIPQQQQEVLPKSRKIHQLDSLENDEERARYMAEFHARPMEMDRKSGAVASIAPSRESSHIFDSQQHVFGGLHPRLTSSVTKLGVKQPTIIQTRAIHALQTHPNANLFIQSETGSGKTLAYLLPILQVRACE